MTDVMEILYTYAQDRLLRAYLCEDQTYAASDLCAQRQTEQLRAALTEQEQIHLKNCWTSWSWSSRRGTGPRFGPGSALR